MLLLRQKESTTFGYPSASPVVPIFPGDSHQNQGDTRKAILLISLIIAVLIGLVASQLQSDPPVHSQTHFVVLADQTDPLSETQMATLESEVQRWSENLMVGDRVSIFALAPGEDGHATRLLFSAQKPRDGRDANPLTENPKQLAKAYEQLFRSPLQAALKALEQPRPTPQTPILQALYEVINQREFRAADRTVLHLWSDCLEYSPVLDHFKNGYSFAALSKQHLVYLEDIKQLQGVKVTVFQLRNQWQRLQTPALNKFWQEYFQVAGVSLDDYEVKPL